jgi:hypothetical protein
LHSPPFSRWATGGAIATKTCAQAAYETNERIASFCVSPFACGVDA